MAGAGAGNRADLGGLGLGVLGSWSRSWVLGLWESRTLWESLNPLNYATFKSRGVSRDP